MSKNIEIEFKNMLTHGEYSKIKSTFLLTEEHFFTQENHYFDTAAFSLKKKGIALRIRKKGNRFEMTLKQPLEIGLLETNQQVTENEVNDALIYGRLPSGEISSLIEELGIPYSGLEYFGTLVTKRAEFPYEKGLMVLDYSTYFNTDDFELEYEVDDYETGQAAFSLFLKRFDIPERITKNKISRFYDLKYKG